MRGQALLAVGALASALMIAQPASAQGGYYSATPAQTQAEIDCRNSQNRRTLAGGAIGAIAGAVLGNNLGARNHQGDGTVLGTVLGGAAGAMIGRQTARCSTSAPYQQGYNQPYQRQYQEPYREPYRGRGDDYGLDGRPSYTPSSYGGGRNGPECREMRDPEGYMMTMCRGRDGRWYPED